MEKAIGRFSRIAAAAVAAAALWGCGGNTPAKSAAQFVKAVCAGDFAAAREWSVDRLADELEKIPQDKRPRTKVKCDAERPLPRGPSGQSIAVRVTAKTGWNAPVQLHLAKIDGRWVVENDLESVRILLSAPRTDAADGGGAEEEDEDY